MYKLIWSALVAVPLAVGGGWLYANAGNGFTCPVTGEELPCPNCCPFNK